MNVIRLKITYLIIISICAFGNLYSQELKNNLTDENIVLITSDDPEMNKAIEQARETWDTFVSVYKQRKRYNRKLSIKYPFQADESYEHLWLGNLRIINGKVTGWIRNTPKYTTEVRRGDKIEIDPKKISDWMYFEHGKMKGGFTVLVALEQLDENEKNKMKKMLGID